MQPFSHLPAISAHCAARICVVPKDPRNQDDFRVRDVKKQEVVFSNVSGVK